MVVSGATGLGIGWRRWAGVGETGDGCEEGSWDPRGGGMGWRRSRGAL